MTWAAALLLASLARFEAVEAHMGTLVRITVYAPDAASAERGLRAAFARVAEIDARLSDYNPESELSRACSAGPVIPPSRDLLNVVRAALALQESTGGALDITMGQLTHAWRRGQVPRAGAGGGLSRGKLRLTGGRLACEGAMQLDAGGIAKGYAADEAIAVLERMGLGRALVAVSGDIVAGEAPPGEDGWRIGLPASDRVIVVAGTAVSTSGDTEQYRVVDGVRYSHIIDPRSGMPLRDAPVVTVVSRRGIDADSIATALNVLGTTAGVEWAASRSRVAARFVERGKVCQTPRDAWVRGVFRGGRGWGE